MKELFNPARRRQLAFGVGIIAVAASCLAFTLGEEKTQSKDATVRLVVNEDPITRDGKFTTSFSPVVKKVAPSVVKVFTTSKIKEIVTQRRREGVTTIERPHDVGGLDSLDRDGCASPGFRFFAPLRLRSSA